jgi:hypothetical protein
MQGRTPDAPAGASGRYRCCDPTKRFLGVVAAAGGVLRAERLARTD